jgi:hypothetical protein
MGFEESILVLRISLSPRTKRPCRCLLPSECCGAVQKVRAARGICTGFTAWLETKIKHWDFHVFLILYLHKKTCANIGYNMTYIIWFNIFSPTWHVTTDSNPHESAMLFCLNPFVVSLSRRTSNQPNTSIRDVSRQILRCHPSNATWLIAQVFPYIMYMRLYYIYIQCILYI